jgi:hypothetical protein
MQMTIRKVAAATLSVGSLLALGLSIPAMAQTKAATDAPAHVSETPSEHQALAEGYRKKAATYREEATTHRQMLESYKKQVTNPPDVKSGRENTWVKKMRLHCEEYIRDADKLATDADKFADFHRMRAAELKGQ